jgi:hypothetical protein
MTRGRKEEIKNIIVLWTSLYALSQINEIVKIAIAISQAQDPTQLVAFFLMIYNVTGAEPKYVGLDKAA